MTTRRVAFDLDPKQEYVVYHFQDRWVACPMVHHGMTITQLGGPGVAFGEPVGPRPVTHKLPQAPYVHPLQRAETQEGNGNAQTKQVQ